MNGQEARALEAVIASGQCPSQIAPLHQLTGANPRLFDKLTQDPLVETYSVYGFFPGVYDLVYNQTPLPEIVFHGRTRGRVAVVKGSKGGLVIKPMQNSREDLIAGVAGKLGVGPRQLPSLPGFLTEEFIPGQSLTELPAEKITDQLMGHVGHELGRMLSRLHQNQIYYNDASLSDPAGRSHLLVQEDGSCRLIDYGVSLSLDQYPHFSQEEVYNFVRTLPMFHLFSGMGTNSREMGKFLEQYRKRMGRASTAEIMGRDLRFVDEGLRFAAQRLGAQIVAPFREGFRESYPTDS